MAKINLIPYPCGLGAQKAECGTSPDNFKNLRMFDKNQWIDFPEITTDETNKPNAIYGYCKALAGLVNISLNNGDFPVTIGGDHSMAIGTWSAVTHHFKAQEKFGLIWIDAHMDSHTPETSGSGAYHGMPLATLLGFGDPDLCSIFSSDAKLAPEHVCLIGIRSFEKAEKELLDKLGVKVFYMDDVKEHGISKIFHQALQIANNGTKAYGVSIDLDGFDPTDAPGTGSLEDDGILAQELLAELQNIKGDTRLKALEIAEYNHLLDKNEKTAILMRDIINNITK